MGCPGHCSYRGAAEGDRWAVGNGYSVDRGMATLQSCFKGLWSMSNNKHSGTPKPHKGFDSRSDRFIPALPRLITTGSKDESPPPCPQSQNKYQGLKLLGQKRRGRSLLLGRQGAHPLPRTGTYGAEVRGMRAGGAHRDRVSSSRWHVQNRTWLGGAGYS